MDLASAEAEIRHVFGDTPITEASIGAAPPDILVKLSGTIALNICSAEGEGCKYFGVLEVLLFILSLFSTLALTSLIVANQGR